MQFYVYVLRSLKNGRFYIGSINNLTRRIREHNSGQSGYTKFTKPFVLAYNEEFTTRKEAVKKELFHKTGIGREWIYRNFK